jgi:hypothetical protein
VKKRKLSERNTFVSGIYSSENLHVDDILVVEWNYIKYKNRFSEDSRFNFKLHDIYRVFLIDWIYRLYHFLFQTSTKTDIVIEHYNRNSFCIIVDLVFAQMHRLYIFERMNDFVSWVRKIVDRTFAACFRILLHNYYIQIEKIHENHSPAIHNNYMLLTIYLSGNIN